MEKQDLKEIKKWLERGDIKEVAIKHELDPSTAYNIMNGNVKTFKVDFISEIIDKALENKAKVMNRMNSLKQLR